MTFIMFVAVAHIENIKENGKYYITVGESIYINTVETKYKKVQVLLSFINVSIFSFLKQTPIFQEK